MADKKNINELIALIERNRVATGQSWNKSANDIGIDEDKEEEEEGEEEVVDEDYSKTLLLIFAADSPFTESLLPMLDQHDVDYAITDNADEIVEIAVNNPQIRHVILDMDRPTDPAMGVNAFMELKMLNPGMLVFYCTKNPMTVEARRIQNQGAKLIPKPILRKTLDSFMEENFKK
ncbi:MAG: hypothetical protein FWB94_11995 [Chitinispirillia bacterium]|nr:hypothetical protein [Chitinispirillia bacterium]